MDAVVVQFLTEGDETSERKRRKKVIIIKITSIHHHTSVQFFSLFSL
jgi:hypothetical protein